MLQEFRRRSGQPGAWRSFLPKGIFDLNSVDFMLQLMNNADERSHLTWLSVSCSQSSTQSSAPQNRLCFLFSIKHWPVLAVSFSDDLRSTKATLAIAPLHLSRFSWTACLYVWCFSGRAESPVSAREVGGQALLKTSCWTGEKGSHLFKNPERLKPASCV